VRVRPWGNIGDRKNDGYLRSKRQLFQCYAPRGLELKKILDKMNEDFVEALPHWKQHFDEWIFTHNDLDGVAPDVLSLLLELSDKHKPLRAHQWGYNDLLGVYKGLPETGVASLLGPAPGRGAMMSVRLRDVQALLEHIALQPEPTNVDVRPVPQEKLKYNQLSDAVVGLVRAGMSRAELVRKYLGGVPDPTRYDRAAASFRQRYQELKAEGRSPDDIFVGLQKFVSGDTVAAASQQAATLAILAFFFEACEIFERPPDEPTSVQA
jgi:hypothetical protein